MAARTGCPMTRAATLPSKPAHCAGTRSSPGRPGALEDPGGRSPSIRAGSTPSGRPEGSRRVSPPYDASHGRDPNPSPADTVRTGQSHPRQRRFEDTMTRITIARMHRDPHTNEFYPARDLPAVLQRPGGRETAGRGDRGRRASRVLPAGETRGCRWPCRRWSTPAPSSSAPPDGSGAADCLRGGSPAMQALPRVARPPDPGHRPQGRGRPPALHDQRHPQGRAGPRRGSLHDLLEPADPGTVVSRRPLSALHPQGRVQRPADAPECAHYALQVCPYLAAPHYAKRVTDARRVAQAGLGIGINPGSDTERPALFVLVMAVGQSVHWSALPTIRPRRPYRAVEYWQSGALARRRGSDGPSPHGCCGKPAGPRVPRLIQANRRPGDEHPHGLEGSGARIRCALAPVTTDGPLPRQAAGDATGGKPLRAVRPRGCRVGDVVEVLAAPRTRSIPTSSPRGSAR